MELMTDLSVFLQENGEKCNSPDALPIGKHWFYYVTSSLMFSGTKLTPYRKCSNCGKKEFLQVDADGTHNRTLHISAP